jgi:hypothetical protein
VAVDIRSTPEKMDPAWLTAQLESAGVARRARVTGFEMLGYIGTGQTGANARLALTWDNPEGRPATLVAKFPSRDPHAATTAFGSGTYYKEWLFYHDVKSTVRIRTPEVWTALFDAEVPDFVLLMEDIAGSQQADQIEGLTVDQAALAAAEAVNLHAPRWGDPALASLFGTVDVAAEVGKFEGFYNLTLQPFLDRLGSRLDPEVIELVKQFAAHTARWVLGMGTPATLVHMDYRPDNFLFAVSDSAPPLVVVDWQTLSVGPAMNDLAYMIGGAFQPAERARVERDLVEDYRKRLVATGIEYDAETCWRDYRVASLWGVAMTVIATIFAAETERGNDMLTAMAQRHSWHAIDLDAISLLQ